MGIENSKCNEDKLKRHNEYIIEEIKKTKEFQVYSRIKLIYEDLIKKADDKKKEIYTHQYNIARNIFTKRIEIYNQRWKKIGEE
ncbi:MAG: hypothetical protein QXO35_03145 [Candidatus Micrarchaeia archaeon]